MTARYEYLFATVMGLTDGISTALVLASGKLLSGHGLGLGEALRIALATGAAGALPLFIAEYARLRGELVHASRELNMESPHSLISGALGRSVMREASQAAVVAAISSLVGALVPLGCGVLFPKPVWLPLLAADIGLALLGMWLGRTMYGHPAIWALILLTIGDGLALLGFWLRIAN